MSAVNLVEENEGKSADGEALAAAFCLKYGLDHLKDRIASIVAAYPGIDLKELDSTWLVYEMGQTFNADLTLLRQLWELLSP